ncbi:MAG: 50S ribosomal protein L4 [Candidatus Roizmanbacteria bacterium]
MAPTKKQSKKEATARVVSPAGTVKEVALSSPVFNGEVNLSLLAQYIRVFMANARQGTASTKDRSQIIGTTKKVYKQKGTGNARHGSMKAPIYVGGGVAGGPKPRDYTLSLSKKQRTLAMQSALSQAANAGKIVQLSKDFASSVSKSKQYVNAFTTAKIPTRSTLVIVDAQQEGGFIKAVRNIADVTVATHETINPYLIARAHLVVFSDVGYEQFLKRFTP